MIIDKDTQVEELRKRLLVEYKNNQIRENEYADKLLEFYNNLLRHGYDLKAARYEFMAEMEKTYNYLPDVPECRKSAFFSKYLNPKNRVFI